MKSQSVRELVLSSAVLFAGAAYCFDDSTIGFFAFKDGSAGSVPTAVANAITASDISGGTFANASVIHYSNERPGQYLFEGSCLSENLLTSDYQSLCLGSGARTSSTAYGTIQWNDAGKALSKCHGTGYTFEFFFKMNPDDKWYPWDYQVRVDAGYKKTDGDAQCPVNIGILYGDSTKTFRAACSSWESGPYKGTDVNVQNKIPGFTYFPDGKWHHFAMVGRPHGDDVALEFYIDYVLVSSYVMDHATVYAKENGGSYIMIGYGSAWASTIAGVRMSNKPRSADEMLHAGNVSELSDGTLAFYSFKNVASGLSASGTGSVRNDVDMSCCVGSVSVDGTGTESFAKIDENGPNRYVFDGKKRNGSKPILENPGAIWFSSASTGKSGVLELLQMGTRLSELHESGYTLEYFIKYDDNKATSWSPCLCYNAGYSVDSASRDFRIYMPLSSPSRTLCYSFGVQDYAAASEKVTATLPFDFLTDGKWHHVAIVESPIATGRVSLAVYVDYVQYSSLEVDASQITVNQNVQICMNNIHAKYSCIRVKTKPLTADEFLHASSRLPAGLMLLVR